MSRGKVNTEKIDTWISADTLKALNAYMVKVDRNKADAIRILLKQALDTESRLDQVQCVHEYVPCNANGNSNTGGTGESYAKCHKCGYRP